MWSVTDGVYDFLSELGLSFLDCCHYHVSDTFDQPGTVMGGGRSRQAFYALIILFLRQLTPETLAWTGRRPLLAGYQTSKNSNLKIGNSKLV